MTKIIFVDDGEHKAQEADARAIDATEMFRLAERLSDAELEKLKRAVNKIEPEKLQEEA